MDEKPTGYPVSLSIEYPDRPLDKVTTFFRLFTAIPIIIIASLVGGGTFQWTMASETATETTYQLGMAGGIVTFALILVILFQQKYPRWWFDWNVALTKFLYRVVTYVSLMTDQYPSTDEEQSVSIKIDYPDVKEDLDRALPLFKWLLALPHYIILAFLSVAAFVCVVMAWFVILFTGRYPRGLFNFVAGVMRWGLRVEAYAFLLVTDVYPPFSLEP